MMKSAPTTKPPIKKNINTSFDEINVSFDPTHYDWKTMPRKIEIPPNKTSAINIDCRVIRCLGKILLGVFTVPVVAVLNALAGFAIIFPHCYHQMIVPNVIMCSIIKLLLAPVVCLVILAPVFTFAGFLNGIIRGATIANEFSAKPLTQLLTYTKDTYLNRSDYK